jgi:membrane protease YdiL (CAAX protease family)
LIVTFALLAVAIVALWLPLPGGRSLVGCAYPWLLPFAGAVVGGLATGIVQPVGLIWITAFALATYAFARATRGTGSDSGARSDCPRTDAVLGRRGRVLAGVAIIMLSAGLMAHQLPGFNNPRVISATTFSADAIPFRLHLNFDKTLVGLFILGFCHPRIIRATQWRAMAARAWPVTLGMIGLLVLVALASGYVSFQPKFPREAWLWMAVNLCFTCVAEEALFRGFVQAQLQRLWHDRRGGEWLALGIAAVLFGLAHAGGGPAYVALATVAGMGYGWAYLRTGCIEASILTHFALNATHFFGFTYPALQRAT